MTDRPDPLVLRARARPQCLEQVHDLIAQLWDQAPGVPAAARIRFETAVAEVAANVVEHTAGGPDEVALILRLTAQANGVTADFEDDGRPVAVHLATTAFPADDAESGRGLALAQAAADELSYARDGDCNRWHVTVRG